jgi:cyclophilin family peptidyl-prolyl cis-trans isomerase
MNPATALRLLLCPAMLFCATLSQAQTETMVPEPLPATVPVPEPVLSVVTMTLNGRSTTLEMEDTSNPLMLIQTTRGDLAVELFTRDAPQTVDSFLGLAEGLKPFIDPRSGAEVTRPFYDGLQFHRVINRFMIQGGSPTGQSDGGPGFSLADEINADSLGLGLMPVLDEDGYPAEVLGIRDQQNFQRRVLLPLYRAMNIDSEETLKTRFNAVDQRLRALTVKALYELQGYRYSERFQSRAPLRGVIAMANSGPNTAGSQFFITLADAPWLTGQYTVFGKVRAGMEVVESISLMPVDADKRPLEPVTILLIRRVTL